MKPLISPEGSIRVQTEGFRLKPQLILLGAPGSGKGTQASKLVDSLGYGHLSTGDLLRKEIKSESELGNRVKSILSEGKLVDNDTVLELLSSNCELANAHYIFDGYPRNIEQAKALDSVVLKGAVSKALYFNIDLEKLAQRLVNRRTCGGCGEIYNLISKAPVKEGVCDKCGASDLQQRKDDNEETVVTRLNVFKGEIEPILAYYKEQNRLEEVDASGDPSLILEKIKEITEK
jgi:adenylate kinase